jgi:peroxiredoxin
MLLPQEAEETHSVPAVGKPAPAIRLNDHAGRATALPSVAETTQPAGHWTVLAFYPKALTPG